MTDFPVWAESSQGDNQPDQRRLNQARADLAVLPDLTDELARCLTEKAPHDGNSSRSKPGSRPPLRLDVLHLVDPRRKPGWDGEDPRHAKLRDRHGITATLESWTRVIVEEMAEPPELAEVATVHTEVAVLIAAWDWIAEQAWADELADDIIQLSNNVRAALGIRKEPRLRCAEETCKERAFIAPGDFLVCANGHERSVRDLDKQERRLKAMPTSAICDKFGITPAQIWQWHKRGKLKPTEVEDYVGREKTWLPWDVFTVINPDLAAAFDAQEQLRAG